MSQRVSVIVPCYNHEAYIETCLQSLDAQTHSLAEIIAIDDGSTDATWEKLNAAKLKTPLRLIRTENRGAHAALNHGLSLATSEYVALCNSDDFFAPTRIETLLRAVTKHQRRFAFSGVRYVDAQGQTASYPYALELTRKQRDIETFASVGFSLVLSNVAISTGNFFFERSLFAEVGDFRPYRYVHDWDFVLRVLLETEPLYVFETLYNYRLHPNNSYLALAAEAAVECPELMRRFLKRACSQTPPKNPYCPSPTAWPYFFEYFLQHHRYDNYLQNWDATDGPYWKPKT